MGKTSNALKQSVELFAKNIFDDPVFQKNWQGYLDAFGKDIANIFGNNYRAKIGFASTLKNMQDENYKEALRNLRLYVSDTRSEKDNRILARLISECEKHIAPKVYPQKSTRYMQYRSALLSRGFSEANDHFGHFLLSTTENAAFIVNLDDEKYGINIVYGFASTAADPAWFADHGVDNETCQIRNVTFIHDDKSETQASHEISDFYRQFQTLSKDDILALKKERQKAFIGYFARAFKPLGFKKKATKWTKALGNGRSLSFEAQKSAYSDQYYFNVSIHADDDFYKRDCYERVVLDKSDIYNWQLMSEEQTNNLIQFILKTHIEPKIENGGIV